MKNEKLCTDPQGVAGGPSGPCAGHRRLSGLAHVCAEERREWGGQAQWVSGEEPESETEICEF